MTNYRELTAEQLRFYCDEDKLGFRSTAEVAPLEDMIGQERAVKAVEFGLFTKNQGYNIFMSGQAGTGKITYARAAVDKVAKQQPVPSDWCYVNNFENSSQPIVLELPAGVGSMLRYDLLELVETLKNDIPKVFSSDDYEQAKTRLVKGFQDKRAFILEKFNQYAEEQGVLPQWSSTGFAGIPVRDDKAITPEEYQAMEKADREAIEQNLRVVHEKANEILRRMQHLERQVREEVKALDGKIGLFAVGHFIDELQEKYAGYQQIVDHLEAVKQDVVKNINDFKATQLDEESNPLLMFQRSAGDNIKNKYTINLLVDNRHCQGAPVIFEINPTYYNLLGRVEYENRMGVVSTDYTMIKAGALHKANGGYLILNARDVLTNLGAWEALKRVLKTRELFIENLGEQYGMLAMASVKPQPILLDVKVILIGNPMLYYLMVQHDEDFRKLFKIHADFDVQMDNTTDNIAKLAAFISSAARQQQLKAFDRTAVARVVEYACRLAGSQKKLTARLNEIVELLCEADAWADIDASDMVGGVHIVKAIEEKRNRLGKYEDKLQELFTAGKFLLDTEDKKIGQVNGLAVMAVGEHIFGKPSRITANTYLGKSGVINIERETEMSGTSHTKGVLILGGYLGQTYAQQRPLTLTASLTFEQLYDGVDGDSASSTELYAILSSLSDLPIKQSIAVTGSVNQKGEIQPIGGATQKIEGFFAVCQIKGLTGSQGVMIPEQNVDELMLNDEVVAAVQAGKFHIYPVKTIDEGIEVLTGVAAGQRQADGSYPEGSVHALVHQKLAEYTETLIKLSKQADDKEK